MPSRVAVASLLLALAATGSEAHAQYFRQRPLWMAPGGAGLGSGTVEPDPFTAYATPGDGGDRQGTGEDGQTYRTLCVRLCDGFYFPISFATRASGFSRDAEHCAASCGAQARLYVHLNPGGSIETMRDSAGRAYSALATAFQYRTALVAGCSCRPSVGGRDVEARRPQPLRPVVSSPEPGPGRAPTTRP